MNTKFPTDNDDKREEILMTETENKLFIPLFFDYFLRN
jgi:hypothetical protein